MKNNNYVYIYLNPLKPGKFTYKNLNMSFLYKPFYIGKGSNLRYKDHINEVKAFFKGKKIKYKLNKHKFYTILKILQNKKEIIILFYENNLSTKIALNLEKKLIKLIGLNNLTNIGKGGSGGDNISGHPNKKEIIKKISNASKQLWKNKQYRQKMLECLTGNNNGRYLTNEQLGIDHSTINIIIDLYKNRGWKIKSLQSKFNITIISRILKENSISLNVQSTDRINIKYINIMIKYYNQNPFINKLCKFMNKNYNFNLGWRRCEKILSKYIDINNIKYLKKRYIISSKNYSKSRKKHYSNYKNRLIGKKNGRYYEVNKLDIKKILQLYNNNYNINDIYWIEFNNKYSIQKIKQVLKQNNIEIAQSRSSKLRWVI